MEGLEEKNLSSGDTFLKYGQVFFALLLFIFAIDLLTVGIGNINEGLLNEILETANKVRY